MTRARPLPGAALLRVDRVRELAEIDVERAQEREERVPPDSSVSVLNLGDVGRADLDSRRQRLLGEPCPLAEFPQRLAKYPIRIGVRICSMAGRGYRSTTFTVGLSYVRLVRPNIPTSWRPR